MTAMVEVVVMLTCNSCGNTRRPHFGTEVARDSSEFVQMAVREARWTVSELGAKHWCRSCTDASRRNLDEVEQPFIDNGGIHPHHGQALTIDDACRCVRDLEPIPEPPVGTPVWWGSGWCVGWSTRGDGLIIYRRLGAEGSGQTWRWSDMLGAIPAQAPGGAQ